MLFGGTGRGIAGQGSLGCMAFVLFTLEDVLEPNLPLNSLEAAESVQLHVEHEGGCASCVVL